MYVDSNSTHVEVFQCMPENEGENGIFPMGIKCVLNHSGRSMVLTDLQNGKSICCMLPTTCLPFVWDLMSMTYEKMLGCTTQNLAFDSNKSKEKTIECFKMNVVNSQFIEELTMIDLHKIETDTKWKKEIKQLLKKYKIRGCSNYILSVYDRCQTDKYLIRAFLTQILPKIKKREEQKYRFISIFFNNKERNTQNEIEI